MRRTFILLAVLTMAWAGPVASADEAAAWRTAARWDEVDETATAEIHVHTTDDRFLTPLVSYIPEDRTVPSPRDVLGYVVGTEGRLTRPRDTAHYFRALAQASPRVDLLEMGRTDEDRALHLVIVSSEENMARLEQCRSLTAELADPRATDEARARELAAQGKPIVYITAGLHSPETGPPEMVMELAYRLAVSDHPQIRRIRDNVVTLITPVLEVDGRARQVDWYYRYLNEHEDLRHMPLRSPPYWGRYVFHDNNRDGIQMSQRLTVDYVKTFFDWHPTYSLDLHESVPLLYVSIGTGPYNRALDPIVISEWQWIATWEVSRLTQQGLPGVWTWGFYTGWNPSYLLWVTNNHNALGRFYETYGNSTARTVERDLSRAEFAGKKVTSRQWYRARPPEKELSWSLRNNTNYMQSGVLASLDLVANNGETLLYNFWRKGRNSLERGRKEPPHAWVIPADQRDRGRLAYLVNQLRRHGIEVHRAEGGFELDDRRFARGDFVVRLDQPYGDFARSLLMRQTFPEDAEQRPYEDVSWTLGLHYGVETVAVQDPAVFELEDLHRVEETVSFPGEMSGSGAGFWAVRNVGQNALVTARYRLSGYEVQAAEQGFEAGGESFPPGSWIVPAREGVADELRSIATEMGLDVHALKKRPEVDTHALDLPRLALYHNWIWTQDDGWVRFALEQTGVPYDYINDDDLRAGGLRERYDVILVAHQGGGNLKRLIHGRDPKFGPMAYTPVDEFPSHGVIDQSPDITGGMGFQGLANLERFLDGGGTLVLLGSAGRLATDTGLLRNVSTSTGSGIATPGSHLRAKVRRADHPLVYGFDEVHSLFRISAPVYEVAEHYGHWIVVQWGTREEPEDGEGEEPEEREPLLISGYVVGGEALERKAAVLDVPRHRGGRVVLYSFNPMHRFLNHADHNYVFNAILNWNDFPEPEPEHHPGLARD